jgi:hypothetical protein
VTPEAPAAPADAGAGAAVADAGVLRGAAGGSGTDDVSTSSTTGAAITRSCTGLECQQTSCRGMGCALPACAGGAQTTVAGTVYDPAGRVPLYNAVVYVPNAPLAPLADGPSPSCDRCGTTPSGSPLAEAVTDSTGQFTLLDAPAGDGIPLVVQIGKWRRQTMIPHVEPCAATVLTDPALTRLPRNQGEGHLPKIGLTTGGYDALECLLRKVGIDDSEFTTEDGDGRVNLFFGVDGTNQYAASLNGGAMFRYAPAWWDVQASLMRYDLILHSCEGTEFPSNKSPAALAAMKGYADAGGRIFASHWHNFWIEYGPSPFPSVATFDHQPPPPSPFTATVDTSFPRGMAMASWLMNVGATPTFGQLPIVGAKHTVDAVTPGLAQRWIYSDDPQSVQYLSFNTPVGAPAGQECGKVVFSDLHLSGTDQYGYAADRSGPTYPFPTGCLTTDLSPQQKALEFMLFDLSACTDPLVPVP